MDQQIEILRPLMEQLAEGGCVDEGERATDWEGLHPVMRRKAEDRAARVEYDPGAAPWLFANPPESIPDPYRRAMIALAANPSRTVRRALCDAMAGVTSIPGELEVRPTASRQTSTAEFMEDLHWGVAALTRYEGLERTQAETEYLWRYAEKQTGIFRCPQRSKNAAQKKLRNAKNAAYMRAYNNA
jgi:hypothetical protein